MTPASARRLRYALVVLLLAALVAVAFGGSLQNAFLHWGGDLQGWRDPHLDRFDWPAVRWALTTLHGGSWHPLTQLSHALDMALFGLDPVPMRAENLLLHTLNAVALFFLAERLIRRWAAGRGDENAVAPFAAAVVGAMVFAVHPLRVEPVVWIAGRKELLDALFYLLALHAWLGWIDRRGRGRYWTAAGLFFLAGAAQPAAVTLPALLLVLDAFPLRRDRERSWGALVWEKLPLFAISALFILLTVIAQGRGGVLRGLGAVPLGERLLNADNSLLLYIGKTVWPQTLLPHYPYPPFVTHFGLVAALELVVVLGLAAWAVGFWRRGVRAPAAALLAYLVMLLPVLGLFQAGNPAAADRFTYLATVPLYLVPIAAVMFALPRLPRALTLAVALALALWIGWLGSRSAEQAARWRDDYTLWAYTVGQDPHDPVAQASLGAALMAQGRYPVALAHLRRAVVLAPGYTAARTDEAFTLLALGRNAEAERLYAALVARQPENFALRVHLGVARFNLHHYRRAQASFIAALRLKPDNVDARIDLAYTWYALGDYARARRTLAPVLKRAPANHAARTLDGLLRKKEAAAGGGS